MAPFLVFGKHAQNEKNKLSDSQGPQMLADGEIHW